MYKSVLQALSALSPAQWRRGCLPYAMVIALVLPSFNVSAEIFEGEELKDPTRPVGASLSNGIEGEGFLADLFGSATSLLNSNYKVTFIRAGGTTPVAMINERLVKTGDMIGEAEVISIDAQSVSLRINGAIQRVTSYSNTMKTQADLQ